MAAQQDADQSQQCEDMLIHCNKRLYCQLHRTLMSRTGVGISEVAEKVVDGHVRLQDLKYSMWIECLQRRPRVTLKGDLKKIYYLDPEHRTAKYFREHAKIYVNDDKSFRAAVRDMIKLGESIEFHVDYKYLTTV